MPATTIATEAIDIDYTFNSLFEMPSPTMFCNACAISWTFNSLFEMPDAGRSWRRGVYASFNSLFEMLIQ